MARVTVQDCIKFIPNKFELVILTSQRVKEIDSGDNVIVEHENYKSAVIALREIASGDLDIKNLKENLVSSLREKHSIDKIDAKNLDATASDAFKDEYSTEFDGVTEIKEEVQQDSAVTTIFSDDVEVDD